MYIQSIKRVKIKRLHIAKDCSICLLGYHLTNEDVLGDSTSAWEACFQEPKNRTLEALEVEEEGKKREKQRAICSFPREPSVKYHTNLHREILRKRYFHLVHNRQFPKQAVKKTREQ